MRSPREGLTARHVPVKFTADGKHLIAVDQYIRDWSKGAVGIFDAITGEELQSLKDNAQVISFDLSPDGAKLVMGSVAGQVTIWDLESGTKEVSLPGVFPGRWAEAKFSKDGKLVLATYRGIGTARIWNAAKGTLLAEITLSDELLPAANGVAEVSPDGKNVIFGYGPQLCVYEIASQKVLSPMMKQGGTLRGVFYLPDGRRVVSWGTNRSAHVWNCETGEVDRSFEHEKGILAAAVSPDGSRLLTGTGDQRGIQAKAFARLWDLETGDLIGMPFEHPSDVNAVVFSPDGLRAATGCLIHRPGDGAVRILDAWSGEILAAPIFHARGAKALSFNADGTQIVVSSRHRDSVVWSVQAQRIRPPAVFTPRSGLAGDF